MAVHRDTSGADEAASQLTTSPSLSLYWPRPISSKSELSSTALILGDEAHSGSYHGSPASYTPVSPTDTAGTHSHFTHAQAQPHQSTALLRVAMDHHLTTQAASGSPLHSALFQPSRARPQQHAVCEIQQRPGPVEAAADALMQLDAGLNSDADQLGCGGRRAVLAGASRRGRCGAFEMQPRRVDVGESHPALGARANGREASSPPGG